MILCYFQVNYLLGKQAYFGKTASEVNALVLDLVSLTQFSVITQTYQVDIGVVFAFFVVANSSSTHQIKNSLKIRQYGSFKNLLFAVLLIHSISIIIILIY